MIRFRIGYAILAGLKIVKHWKKVQKLLGGMKMNGHPIEGLMTTAMENLKQMIDVNTIIGDPVETPDGSVILTVSKVGFGFAAGGSEFMLNHGNEQQKKLIRLVAEVVGVYRLHRLLF